MTTPINTFHDILDAIERDPALRDELRRRILCDEMLQLPAQFRVFLEAVADMREALNRMENDVGTLKTDVETSRKGSRRSGTMSADSRPLLPAWPRLKPSGWHGLRGLRVRTGLPTHLQRNENLGSADILNHKES